MDAILTAIISTTGASVLNFIATKAYNAITGSSKNYFWKNKEKKLATMKPSIDFEEIKKRVRIVVIDDENGFPVKLFQSEGYAVDKWDKVTDVSYGRLESGFYDIIVLDIKGVAQDISNDDGLGVLVSLKEKNPAQIIIAYSQHSYDLSYRKFFELADESIAKPSDFLKIKTIIDNLINTKYKPTRYIETLHKLLENNGINKIEIKKLDAEMAKAIQSKEQPNWKKILGSIKDNSELLKQAMTLGNTILKFFQ